MSKLRFGDFTGDGVTDVLAVESGHWAISESARSGWRRLNPTLGDAVENLFIANMDADDNIDDLLRLDTKTVRLQSTAIRRRATWYRSRNGREPWRLWKDHEFAYTVSPETVGPGYAFAGRFGAAPGGGTLVIGPNRLGHFHSQPRSQPAPRRTGRACSRIEMNELKIPLGLEPHRRSGLPSRKRILSWPKTPSLCRSRSRGSSARHPATGRR